MDQLNPLRALNRIFNIVQSYVPIGSTVLLIGILLAAVVLASTVLLRYRNSLSLSLSLSLSPSVFSTGAGGDAAQQAADAWTARRASPLQCGSADATAGGASG